MYAIIDIGSNTIRLNVYQVEEDGAIHSIFQSKETAGLAGYVREDGSMSREGLDRAADALLRFRSILDALHIENRAVFATASLRNITNSEEAVFQLQERTGLMIRLLSGREEAILDYVGATSGMEEREQGMVLDIGGGSLEVAMGSDEEPTVALSAPAGAGRVTTEFLPSGMATPDELEDVRKNVRKILEPMVKVFPQSKHPNHAVGTSKTFRSLARLCGAVMRAPGREDSWIMTREQLEDWIPRLAAIAPEQRVALPGITPERTMQIVGGGVVADEIMKALNIQEVEICPWALREGAILRWLDQFGRTRLGF